MNKLTMSLVICAALFAAAPSMAHETGSTSNRPHQCSAECECKCSRIRDTCLPILRRIRPTRRALCQYRCTIRSIRKDPCAALSSFGAVNGQSGIFQLTNPVCHSACSQLHPNPISAGRYLCDARCHDDMVISPGIPSDLLP